MNILTFWKRCKSPKNKTEKLFDSNPKLREMAELMKPTDKFDHFPLPNSFATKVYFLLNPEEPIKEEIQKG